MRSRAVWRHGEQVYVGTEEGEPGSVVIRCTGVWRCGVRCGVRWCGRWCALVGAWGYRGQARGEAGS